MSNAEKLYIKKLKRKANHSGENLVKASKRLGRKKSNEIFDKSYESSLDIDLDPYDRN